jgi:tripartite-type tricarboxylate transporter receptor subunit TctC
VAGVLMAKAVPDGHTLFTASNGEISISPNLYKKLAYDPAKDIVPVSRIGASQLALVVHPGVAAQSVKELIALAKAKPGAINFASSGIGSTAHLCAELLKYTASIESPVRTRAGPAPAEVMGGQVQMFITGFSSAAAHVRGALGVTSWRGRSCRIRLPSVKQCWVIVTSWYGLL